MIPLKLYPLYEKNIFFAFFYMPELGRFLAAFSLAKSLLSFFLFRIAISCSFLRGTFYFVPAYFGYAALYEPCEYHGHSSEYANNYHYFVDKKVQNRYCGGYDECEQSFYETAGSSIVALLHGERQFPDSNICDK